MVVSHPTISDLKIVYSYVFETADSESDLSLHSSALISEIFAFLRKRVTITIEGLLYF